MSKGKGSINWDAVNRRERHSRRKAFSEQNVQHRRPAPPGSKTTKADLRRMMAEAAANTAKLK